MLPATRERELSPRVNRSNSAGCSASGMPGPVSVTVTVAASALDRETVTVVPGGVCTRAFASRFTNTW